jgi:hypothetical protein
MHRATRKLFIIHSIETRNTLFYMLNLSCSIWAQDTQIGRKLSENSIFFDALGVWGAGGGYHSF